MSRGYGRKSSGGRCRQRAFLFHGTTGTIHCCHCGRGLRQGEATLDHIVPRSMGGSNKIRNLALACERCNRERGDRDFWEFRESKRSWRMSVKLFQIEMVVSTAGERGGTHYGGPVPVSADSFGAVLRRLVEGYHGDNGVLIEKLVVKEVRGEEVDVQASKAGV